MFAAGVLKEETPRETPGQNVMISCTMMVGAVSSAIMFGAIAHIIAEISEGDSRYIKFMLNLAQRMARKQLPQHIRKRVFQHYENMWAKEKSLENDRHTFLQDLSPALSRDVNLALCRNIIDTIPVKMHPSATECLVLHMVVGRHHPHPPLHCVSIFSS